MKTKDDITINDCMFMMMAILPNGNIHYVNVKSDEIADFLAERESFQVYDPPIGRVEEVKEEITLGPLFGKAEKDKYLD
jgi:hypothetical protein